MKIYIFILTLLLLLLSCSSEQDNNNNNEPDFDLDQEVIVSVNGFHSDDIIFTRNHQNSYPSQMFDKRIFVEEHTLKEINDISNPYSLIFDFLPIPYIEKIDNPQGFLSFNKAIANAMKTEANSLYINSNLRKSDIVSYGIFSTTDKAKLFLKDRSLMELLEDNTKKYIFLARIISTKFDVLSDINLENEDILYINSLSFGRYAYISISTDDPEYVIDVFKNGILKKDNTYINKYVNISSYVNIIERGGPSLKSGYLGSDGFYTLMNIFDISSNYTGSPIYFTLRDSNHANQYLKN